MTIEDLIADAVFKGLSDIRRDVAEIKDVVANQRVRTSEAATILGISERQVKRLLADGRIPCERKGRSVLIPRSALKAPTDDEITAPIALARARAR